MVPDFRLNRAFDQLNALSAPQKMCIRDSISVLDSFLLAVFHQRLVVEVDGTVIDAATLPNLMAIYSSKFEENADKYYAVLTASDKESKIFEEDILGLGTVKLKMMIQPGMHRKCAMVRKTGMKILDLSLIHI